VGQITPASTLIEEVSIEALTASMAASSYFCEVERDYADHATEWNLAASYCIPEQLSAWSALPYGLHHLYHKLITVMGCGQPAVMCTNWLVGEGANISVEDEQIFIDYLEPRSARLIGRLRELYLEQ
jgi:hypothetical protein